MNETASSEVAYNPTNCAFYNAESRSCRYCQDNYIECLGPEACEMFYNIDKEETVDPASLSITSIMQSFEIQQKQRQLLADALKEVKANLKQAKEDYAQLLADKNDKEAKLMQARAENTRLHEENRRVSLRFANTPTEAKQQNAEKLQELGSLKQQIQTLTEAQTKLQEALDQAQAENTALKIDNGVLAKAREYLESNQANIADNTQITEIMQELSDKLLKGNQELTDKLLANNQEVSDKLLNNSKELSDTILTGNKELGDKLVNGSEEQKRNSNHLLEQIKQVRSKLDNVDSTIANIDDNGTTFKIMIAMLIGGILGVIGGLAIYRMFFLQ